MLVPVHFSNTTKIKSSISLQLHAATTTCFNHHLLNYRPDSSNLLQTCYLTFESHLSPIKFQSTSMGQRGSKMHNEGPQFAGSYHGPSYGYPNQSQLDQNATKQCIDERKRQDKRRKRSRRNGVIAATAGAA